MKKKTFDITQYEKHPFKLDIESLYLNIIKGAYERHKIKIYTEWRKTESIMLKIRKVGYYHHSFSIWYLNS
jgi:hypothetical protein